MRKTSLEELVRELEALEAAEAGGALAFDGDGTLWSGDVGEDYFHALVARGALGEATREPLAELARAHGIDAGGAPTAIAARLYEAYLAGSFPEDRACEIMTWARAGSPRDEVIAEAREIAAGLDLPSRLHPEAIEAARWALGRGLAVFLVSASPRQIIEAAAAHLGVVVSGVAAMTPRYDARGVMEADVERPVPYGEGKVARLTELLAGRALYAAFGDNAFDVPMLRSARVGVAIRPKKRLVDRAADVPGLRVLTPR